MYAVLPFAVLLVLAAVLLPRVRSLRLRRRRLATLALRCSWTYSPSDPWDLAREIEGLCLGAWGHDHRFCDVFSVPTQMGSLWLARFSRQMAGGRHRRCERYAVAIARLNALYGGIAILWPGALFVPADPFARYRPVSLPAGAAPSVRRAWAERPSTDGTVLALLSEAARSLPPAACIEVRGHVAAVYWPLARSPQAQDVLDLQDAGRRLLDLLARGSAPAAQPCGLA